MGQDKDLVQESSLTFSNDSETKVVVPESQKLEDLITEQMLNNESISATQAKHARRIKAKLPAEKSLLAIYQELEFTDRASILKALRKVPVRSSIGTLLVELGYIKEIDLRNAVNIQRQKTPDKNLGRVLIDNHFLSEDLVLDVLSIQMKLPKLDPEFSKNRS